MKRLFEGAGVRQDLLAGFIVFLIALPLSLGIAMASGVPPIAGILAAVVGGLFVSSFGGTYMTISGPAAGLIVVVFHGVEALGHGDPILGYRSFLAVTVVAGALLWLLGKLRAGSLVEFVPSSVVHGLLSAIGVIIFAKQAHVLLGVVPQSKSPLGLLAEVPHSLMSMNPEIALIGAVGLALLLLVPRLPGKFKKVPAPLLVVVSGVVLGQFFNLEHPHKYMHLFMPGHEYAVGPNNLVSLPNKFIEGFTTPIWGQVASWPFFAAVFSLTIIQGLESLLSASAVKRLDPQRRRSDLNRDLGALGLGSMISGFIGGLPFISEIVRSRANVDNGATGPRANFFHAAFLLIFVAAVPNLLHMIPLASLAAILVVTGVRLAAPGQLRERLELGSEQFVMFLVTCFVSFAVDLLAGVAAGLATGIAWHLVRGVSLRDLFRSQIRVEELDSGNYALHIEGAALFTNYPGLRRSLLAIPADRSVAVNVGGAYVVEHPVLEKFEEFHRAFAYEKRVFEVHGLEQHRARSEHALATRRKGKKSESAPSA